MAFDVGSKPTKRKPKISGAAEPVVDRVNATELARRLGVQPHAIAAAKKAGRVHVGPDGLYDADEAMREFERSRQKPAGPGRGHKAPPLARDLDRFEGFEDEKPCPKCGRIRDFTYWSTRAKKEEFLAKRLARLELQGALVRRSAADDAKAELGAMMRTLLESCGGDLQDELAAEVDPRRCADLVNNAIRAALESAADRLTGDEDAEGSGADEEDDEA